MSRVHAVIALLAATAGVASAQSIPPVARTKLVATHAANQTNAHTKQMTTEPTDSGTTPSVAPAQAKPGAGKPVEGAERATESAAGAAVEKPAEATAEKAAGFDREIFVYDRSGRRDPFASLMTSSELRPLLSDLRLVAVAFDETGRNSVAVLRDVNTKDQYRIRVGQSLGRMRASRIDPKSITFTIEEFGFSRQETLGLGDSNKGSSK